MSFSFFQSSGKFCNDKTGECKQSYSGFMGETNEKKSNSGPISVGGYTIGNSCDKSRERCNLIPDASNNMYGRSAFQIHGDNGKGDRSGSHGCIILNQSDRSGLKPGDRVNVKK